MAAQPSVASAKVTAADRKRWKAPQGPFFNDPRRKEGLVPHRAEGHRHDQAHAPGLDDPDRGLLLRPDAGREGAHRRAPAWRQGADDPQRPPVHQGDASDPQGDRGEALPLELHLPVHGRVPEQAEPVQQHAHEVLLVLPGRQVEGRAGRGVGQHDAQRRHPPVERPLLHLGRPRALPPVRPAVQRHAQGPLHPPASPVLLRHPRQRCRVRRLGRQAHGLGLAQALGTEERPRPRPARQGPVPDPRRCGRAEAEPHRGVDAHHARQAR